MRLREIVEGRDPTWGRPFELSSLALILISLASFAVETLPDLSESARRLLWIIEVATVALFTIEYLLRLAVAENRWRYFFSFYGLVDLAAIAPFYLARGFDLRALRALRIFRLFRVLKLTRYSHALNRFARAMYGIREELKLFLLATSLLLFLGATGIYYCERNAQPDAFGSVFDCLWWAVVTFTTVGYGDVYPITAGGRLFTFLMLLLALGVVAVPSGLIAAAMTNAMRDDPDANDAA